MPQTEKPQVQPVDLGQNAGINVVSLGADDVLQGRVVRAKSGDGRLNGDLGSG
jgi:hypothetical protein